MKQHLIDYTHLISLSKNPQCLTYGPQRDLLLNTLEEIINKKLGKTTITGLSTLTLVASRTNINNPVYWKNIADEILKKSKNVNQEKMDTVSVIFFNYVISFPMISEFFFETLENRLTDGVDFLNTRSVSQCIWCFAKRDHALDRSLRAFEKKIIEKMGELNVADLAQIGHSLGLSQKHCQSQVFIDDFCKETLRRLDRLDDNSIIQIAKGLSLRSIYNENFFTFVHQKYLKRIGGLSFTQLLELANTFARFHNDLEIPFMERMHEIRIENHMVKEKNLF